MFKHMPNLNEHILYDIIFFGRELTAQYWWVNHVMDNPWSRIYGKRHRAILHNERGVRAITQAWGPIAGEFARLHILVDHNSTKLKRLTR